MVHKKCYLYGFSTFRRPTFGSKLLKDSLVAKGLSLITKNCEQKYYLLYEIIYLTNDCSVASYLKVKGLEVKLKLTLSQPTTYLYSF